MSSEKAKARCTKITFGTLVGLGILMVIVGAVILGAVFPNILKKKIDEGLVLRNGTEAGDRFIDSPVPSYMTFYLFNVKNKEKVNTVNGTIPELEEVGPFVFRQNKIKTIEEWDEENGSVSYTEKTTYHFEGSMSGASLKVPINHVNVISMTILGVAEGILGKGSVKDSRGEMIETHTADELLFSGISIEQYVPDEIRTFLDLGFVKLPSKAGYYFGKNDTTSKEFTVATGVKGMDNFGEILLYEKKKSLEIWYNDACNAINGTDGKMFPPGVDKDKKYYVFSSDVCRSFILEYAKDVIVEQIDALRYAIPREVFEDPNINRDNMCFCPTETDTCPSKAGVFSIENCEPNKPVAMSAPHFYFGEQEYRDNFKGLDPKEEKHQTFLDIEPMTGTVVRAAKRLQANLMMQQHEYAKFLKYLNKDMYFPMFWIEESGAIDKKTAKEFREKVTNPAKTGKWSLVAVIAIGAVLVLLVGVVTFFKFCK